MRIEAEFPEKLQALFTPSRYKIIKGGRGSAKSWGAGRALLIKGAERPLRFLCARETQKSIAESVHQLLTDQVTALGLNSFYTVQETSIRGINGTEFNFAGLRQQNVTSIKSYEGIDICWVEEAQAVSKRSWEILIPTIRKEDSEIWITFNPELDSDETYVRFVTNAPPNSIILDMNWRDNPWFPETLRAEKDHLKSVDPEGYENIWEGKPRSSVPGAIYAKEILAVTADKRIRPVPYDPLLKVHTVWDLGWNDAMAIILCQRLRSEVRIIEYIEDSHRTLADYVAELSKRSYVWGKDWLPHDGAAKDHKTGKSSQEMLEVLGRKVEIIKRGDIEEGIKAARLMFPRCYFDQDKAATLVDRLKRYRRSINQTTNQPGSPLHDENSHGADAFRGLAQIVDKMDNDSGDFFKPLKYDNRGIV
jgi:phage terminase large subunit